MLLFSFATLLPLSLLVLAGLWGGLWVWAALLVITLFTWLADRLMPAAGNPGSEFPSGNGLASLLALLHLPLLMMMSRAIGGDSGFDLWHRFGLLVAAGLFFGQIGHPNAHELIHRPARGLRRLGKLVYASLLIGHHVSAHPLVHHVHVATDADPSSAPKGMGFWRFAPRCWLGGFRDGLRAENSRRRGRSLWAHPYLHYGLIAVAMVLAVAALAGIGGVVALLLLAAYAQLQMLLADYVQHYGLRRQMLADGRPEPVGPEHSWNTPHRWSSAMMLNAPRHSDHHLHPGRPYPGLRLTTEMPLLPYSLPVMAVVALWPDLWRRLMDPRLAALAAVPGPIDAAAV